MGIHDRDYSRKGRADDDDDVVDDVGDAEPDSVDLHPEGPDAADIGDEDEPDLVRCPNCKKMIHADAVRCPRCGYYANDDETARANRPWWVWVGIALAVVLAAMYAFNGF